MSERIVRVAVPSPLYCLFDYLPAATGDGTAPVGSRVRVSFGRSERIGLVVEHSDHSEVPEAKLKPIIAVLDSEAAVPPDLMQLGAWAAHYYHYPPGEVYAAMVPTWLRSGRELRPEPPQRWSLSVAGRSACAVPPQRLGPRQRAVLRALNECQEGLLGSELRLQFGNCASVLRALEERGLVTESSVPAEPTPRPRRSEQRPELTAAQRDAVEQILNHSHCYGSFLLRGVTGSGKTEVYLRLTEGALDQNKQVLLLVPEIGLTPQLLRRFRRRFNVDIPAFHSGLNDRQRQQVWLAAAEGRAPIVVGTRSAVFTPLLRPGLIVVDEEHDASFKQQDGFRYSGRDLAVVRAQQLGIPVVLGSATPSLESLYNVVKGRYQGLRLPRRAGGAHEPELELMDVRGQAVTAGISRALSEKMFTHLERGEQVLVFINRRGFAPTLLCHYCGWVADCHRCDARLTLHQARNRLVCHHCASEQSPPERCANCGSTDLWQVGQGTERIEQALAKKFPDYQVVRVDRDSTRRKGDLELALKRIQDGDGRILVGTQMLAKGHHFPLVTLVAIVEADQGLLSPDYRAGERLAQLILQVAGRAGRGERPGHVIIQTHQPTHPLLQTLVRRGYAEFARGALRERRQASLPPFAAQALLRAESVHRHEPLTFLQAATALAQTGSGVAIWGPVPAVMERKAGRWRAQLMVHARRRSSLQAFLDGWLPEVVALKEARKVRWALDVDPLETL